MTYEKKLAVRYLGEMFATFALYALTLIGSIHFAEHLPKGVLQTVVVVTPMVPFCLTIVVVIRHLRRLDEFCRQQALENIAIAAAITAGWAFTYGFLEGIGYPRLSMFNVWMVMCSAWAVIAITRVIAGR